jgi:hypothetical protein
MTFSPKALFQPDRNYEGVRRINIYLLRLVYILMFFVLGKDTWTPILTHQGTWEKFVPYQRFRAKPRDDTYEIQNARDPGFAVRWHWRFSYSRATVVGVYT